MCWNVIFPYKAPLSINRMASWRYGSTMLAFDDWQLDWASNYALEMGVDNGKEKLAIDLHTSLGNYFTRIGRIDSSLRHLETAIALCDEFKVTGKPRQLVLRWLAIANLRQGEVDFCITQNNVESCLFPLEGGGQWANPASARSAMRWINEYLAADPNDYGVMWLLNVAHMAEGTWPEAVNPKFLLPIETVGLDDDIPHFTNIAQDVGVNAFNICGGAIMEDFDGDGFNDLIASSYERSEALVYYHNNGDGSFSQWNEKAGIADQFGGLGLSMADYDNDGFVDVFVPRGAWMVRYGKDRNSLLHNNGDGTFTDVTEEAGLGAPDWPCLATSWGDYDNDGDLDLYIGNERLEKRVVAPSQLFRNNGDGTFTDVAKEAGVTNMGHARGVHWGDYDNDGWLDLAISNFMWENRLYHNNGDGTFTDVAAAEGFAFAGFRERTFGCWFMDINNDGWLDLFTSSYPLESTVNPSAASYFGDKGSYEKCQVLINDGSGHFVDKTVEFGMDKTHLTMGFNFADVDSDGWMDIFLSTGSPPFEALVPNLLYKNVEGKRFKNVTTSAGLGHLQKGHGAAFGDIDNDGDLDLWNQLGGWYLDDRFGNALFINDGHDNNVLNVRLVGVDSNRFGVGTRVRALINDGGVSREVHLDTNSGGSFGSSTFQLEIGIGGATEVEELELWWPKSGLRQSFKNIAAGKTIEITEGQDQWREIFVQVVPLKSR